MDQETLLTISGLQRFAYCPREWALVHLEGQWEESAHTIAGNIFHERVHNEHLTEKRGDLIICRDMPVFSRRLGVSGNCDVVEFHKDEGGVPLAGRRGKWRPVPVEYKRGRPKSHDADALQLCCQAMCLEEMQGCPPIEKAYLYYGETARREEILLDESLRGEVCSRLEEMHRCFARQHTPKVKPHKGCNACSLKDVCLPKLEKRPSAQQYVKMKIGEDDL